MTITSHYWIVAGDESRLWHSGRGRYVPADDADYLEWLAEGGEGDPRAPTRIASEEDLADVLWAYGLVGPVVLGDAVRAETARRMRALVGARDDAHLSRIIDRGAREAIRLAIAKDDGTLDAAGAARLAELEGFDDALGAIRDAGKALRAMDPIPADYTDDKWWP